jgi:hypothetical protein
MAIKTKEELFGDNGAYGNQVAIDFAAPTTPPGYGVACRAVGLGEELTSAIANRICYALALNDEDLDGRLGYLEEHGLDGVYRLGAADDAGGGRVITVDGGAVEAQSAQATDLATDAGNALFRANTLSDVINGSVGVDFVAKGAGSGLALFGFLDRRSLVITTSNTKILASNSGVLNPSSAGGDYLGMADTGVSFWAQSSVSDILPGVDLVQVSSGPYRGLYLIKQVLSTANVRLLRLSGAAPNFPANTAVTFVVYRPSLSSAGGAASDRASAGVTVAGVPGLLSGDAAALTLVPGGRNGVDSAAAQGSRYALRVRVLPPNPASERGFVGVTAKGSFITEAFTDFDTEARYAKELKGAGFRYLAPPSSGGPSIAFAALHQDIDNPAYPAIMQSRVEEGSIAGTFDGSGSVMVLQADLGDRFNPAPGTMIELFKTAGGSSLGVFRVKTLGVGDPNTYISLQSLMKPASYGLPPDAYPYPPAPELENIAVTMQFLQGVVVSSEGMVEANGGTMNVDVAEPSLGGPWQKSRATLFATTPYDRADADYLEPTNSIYGSTPAALHVANVAHDPRSLLIRGVDRQDGDTFFVTARGQVSARKGFYSPEGPAIATRFSYPLEQTIEDIPIPPELMSTPEKQSDVYPGWYRNGGESAWTIAPPSAMGVYRELILPITGLAPVGAELTKVKLYYSTVDWLTNQSFVLKIYKRSAFSTTETQIATTVLTIKNTEGTLELAIPAGNFTHRSSPMLFGVVTSRNLTDQIHANNIILLHSAYFSCKVNGLES